MQPAVKNKKKQQKLQRDLAQKNGSVAATKPPKKAMRRIMRNQHKQNSKKHTFSK